MLSGQRLQLPQTGASPCSDPSSVFFAGEIPQGCVWAQTFNTDSQGECALALDLVHGWSEEFGVSFPQGVAVV